MSLTKRVTQVPLGGGVEESVSDVLFDPPLVKSALNARIPKAGMLAKRFGATANAGVLPSTGTYGMHAAIAEQDGRAVVLTQRGAYVDDTAKDLWQSTGDVSPRPSRVLTDLLIRQNNSSAEPEIALVTVNAKTIACVVWCDTDTQDGFYAFCEVPVDGAPLRVINGPTKFGGTRVMAHSIRLATIGTTIYAIGGDNQNTPNVYHCSVDVSASYTFSTPSGASGWSATAMPVALMSDGASALWAVVNESGGGYSIRKLSTAFAETASQTVAGAAALDAIRSGSTIVIVKDNGNVDDVADSLGGAPSTRNIVAVGAGGPLYATATKATICASESSSFFVAWERPATGTPIQNYGVVLARLNASFAATSTGVVGSVLLAGRAAFRGAEGLPLLPVIDIVNTSFWRAAYVGRPATGADGLYTLAELCRFSTDVAAYQPGNAAAPGGSVRSAVRTWFQGAFTVTRTINVLPSPVYDSVSAQWLFPHLVLADLSTQTYLNSATLGIDMLRLSTIGPSGEGRAVRSVSAQGLRVFGGGCGATYVDGPVHAEMTPPPIGLISADQADVLTGIYGDNFVEVTGHYMLAVRWHDEKGNIHRGVPLHAISASPWDDATTPDSAVRFRFPRPFPQTIRGERGGQSYEVEVYAGTSAAGPFYFFDVVTPQPHPTILGVDFIIISDARYGTTPGIPFVPGARGEGTDYIADVPNITSPQPTWRRRWVELGELVHTPTPPVRDICSTQSRVWLLSAEQGRSIVRPSKLLSAGMAPEFASALDIVLPSEGGEATAIAALNDKIVIFKERQIYVLFGDPGDNTGAGSTLQTPRLVQSDVGCSEPLSVVEGPFGIVFRSSAAGFHLLTPGLEVQRLPQLEDTVGDDRILSGVLVADKKEVRWISAGTTTFVWDYEQNAWLTHTYAIVPFHAAVVAGQYTMIGSNGTVYAERESWSSTLDSHAVFLTSAWIKLAGLQGYKRVWKAVFLLRWYTGDLTIQIAADYNSDDVSTHAWTASQLAALVDSDSKVELVCHFTRQKIESFRFTIAEDYPGQATTGRGFELLGVALEWGQKRGSHAHPVAVGARK